MWKELKKHVKTDWERLFLPLLFATCLAYSENDNYSIAPIADVLVNTSFGISLCVLHLDSPQSSWTGCAWLLPGDQLEVWDFNSRNRAHPSCQTLLWSAFIQPWCSITNSAFSLLWKQGTAAVSCQWKLLKKHHGRRLAETLIESSCSSLPS